MISPENIADLTKTRCRNETQYRETVVLRLFERLGYPDEYNTRLHNTASKTWAKRPEIDYLFLVGDIPALAVEVEYPARKFDQGFEQVEFFGRNFNPVERGIRKQNVPYIMVAAGEKVEMFKLEPHPAGLAYVYKKDNPLRGFLTWDELKERVREISQGSQSALQEGEALALDRFSRIFETLSETIASSKRPRFSPDQVIMIMNDILVCSLYGDGREKIYNKYRLPRRIKSEIENILQPYRLNELEGHNLAYAYRKFASRNFVGLGYNYEDPVEVGRYLTPAEIIDFMVKLAEIKSEDKIIDPACGSGGFLGAIANQMINKMDMDRYLKENLFACDIDLFSVSTTKTFLELLLPGRQEALNVFHHNGLFRQKIQTWERKDLSDLIKDGDFDVVIGNPPGGEKYELGHEDELIQLLDLRDKREIRNSILFIKRAIQLAKNRGRICLVVPDGILANARLKYFRDFILSNCQIKGIVSLPRRIFPNVPSKMSILYMIKRKKTPKKQKYFTAGIETDEPYNIESELNEIYEEYLKFQKS